MVEDVVELRPEFEIPVFVSRAEMPDELPDFVTPGKRGWSRILPGLLESDGGLDGFFVARLVRMAT